MRRRCQTRWARQAGRISAAAAIVQNLNFTKTVLDAKATQRFWRPKGVFGTGENWLCFESKSKMSLFNLARCSLRQSKQHCPNVWHESSTEILLLFGILKKKKKRWYTIKYRTRPLNSEPSEGSATAALLSRRKRETLSRGSRPKGTGFHRMR